MGANIAKIGWRCIVIKGVKNLQGTNHHTISDRIEAASFATLALATNGQITVHGVASEHLTTFLNAFSKVGGDFTVRGAKLTFFRKIGHMNPINIETGVHPGFMTDWQQPFVVMLTQVKGTSVVHETVYEKRFDYTKILNSMGAKIDLSKLCFGEPCRFNGQNHLHSCVISGPTRLLATNIEMPDLRAGFAHIIAALIAEGTSNIYGIDQLERGYADVPEKLKSIGASIEVINP